jgi:peptidyl-prolyl cis-trans isomerase D
MFDLFRRKDTLVRYVLTFFLVVIAVSMVITLVPGIGSGGAEGGNGDILAEIGDDKITVREVINNIQQVVRQRNVPAQTVPAVVDLIIDGMINGRAMAYHSKQMGLTVSENDLAQSIKSSFPQLFPDGKFIGTETYANFLAQNGNTVAEFEANLRRDILRARLKQMSADGVVVAPKEVEDEYRATSEKIKIEYVSLSEDSLRKTLSASDAEIAAEYNKAKATFMNPQRYSYSLAILDEARTASLVPVKDEDLLREYNKDKERFRIEESVKVRHILVKDEKKAKEVLAKVKAGGDFAALAKEFSEDPGSKDNGGIYPNVTRGQMVPEFEKATFGLAPNQISDLVKTQFGYHIVQPLERYPAGIRPFEQVKPQLAQEVNRDLILSRMMSNAEQLRNQLLKNPNDIDGAAQKFNAMVVKQDAVGLTGFFAGIGPHPELNTALGTMKKLEVGKVMSTQSGAVVVPVLRDILAPTQQTLEEASLTIKDRILNEKARQAIVAKAPELGSRGKAAGADFTKLAKEIGGDYKKTTEAFARGGFAEGLGSAALLTELFKAPVGTVIGPLQVDTRQFVVRLVEKNEADLTKLAAEREAITKKIKERKAKERTDVFEDSLVDYLLQKGTLKIYEKARQQVNATFRQS